jgi:drug/metabolite transporter (DMT)-like permease
MIFYLPIVLMVVATTFYHVAQKAVPPQVNPLLSLLVNYVTALLATVVLIPFYPHGDGPKISLRDVNWASYGVGVSIVGVELAVLLAYRAGWKISVASVVANVATALLLAIFGVSILGEHLSRRNLAGICLCLLGLVLIAQR